MNNIRRLLIIIIHNFYFKEICFNYFYLLYHNYIFLFVTIYNFLLRGRMNKGTEQMYGLMR